MNTLEIKKGKILLYRAFDIGDEIDLEKSTKFLEQNTSPSRFKLKRESRAMVIKNAPISISLGSWQHQTSQYTLSIEATGKIWHFGVLSIALAIVIPENTPWDKLIEVGSMIENDNQLHNIALQKTKDLIPQLRSAVSNINLSELYEDYMIYFIETATGLNENAINIFNKANVHALILAENKEPLSDQMKKIINESCFQYSSNDLAVIDWNSALVIEPSGSMDVPDVIEFALCQLLELRYYDDVLDEKLASLYNSVSQNKQMLLSNIYSRSSTMAATKYLEISEFIENVENSMKVVGDFYLAQIYRAAVTRFRLREWQISVDNKLKNLADVSTILNGEINTHRSHFLEIIVIILIAVEIIPLFKEIF